MRAARWSVKARGPGRAEVACDGTRRLPCWRLLEARTPAFGNTRGSWRAFDNAPLAACLTVGMNRFLIVLIEKEATNSAF